jgi:hypothetical protein
MAKKWATSHRRGRRGMKKKLKKQRLNFVKRWTLPTFVYILKYF